MPIRQTILLGFSAIALIGVFTACVLVPVRDVHLGIPPRARPHLQIIMAYRSPTAVDIANRLAWAGPLTILLFANLLIATRRSNTSRPYPPRLLPRFNKKVFSIALLLIIVGLIGLRMFLIHQYLAVTMPFGILLLVASCFAIGTGLLLPIHLPWLGGSLGVLLATCIVFYSYSHAPLLAK